MKYFVIMAFALILASLASALVYMLRGTQRKDDTQDTEESRKASVAGAKKMATALGFRVAFSVSLFLIILLLYWLGYIQPTGIPIQK
jgi:NADH:ubiquinone oxidoreductase subunit 2 (subunit N)